MTRKTAKRFLSRNGHRLTVHQLNGTGKAMLHRAKIAKKVLKAERHDK